MNSDHLDTPTPGVVPKIRTSQYIILAGTDDGDTPAVSRKGSVVEETELDRLKRDYDQVKTRISALGFAIPGSVISRYTVCGTTGCKCHQDPPIKHGPYFQYTRKLAGKTITRKVDADQVDLYREWIANRRLLDQLNNELNELARQATARILTGKKPPN